MEWLEFFQWENNHHTKQDYYLAQIALTVMRSQITNPNAIKMDNYLLKFLDPDEQKSMKEQMEKSKMIWAGAVGIDLSKN